MTTPCSEIGTIFQFVSGQPVIAKPFFFGAEPTEEDPFSIAFGPGLQRMINVSNYHDVSDFTFETTLDIPSVAQPPEFSSIDLALGTASQYADDGGLRIRMSDPGDRFHFVFLYKGNIYLDVKIHWIQTVNLKVSTLAAPDGKKLLVTLNKKQYYSSPLPEGFSVSAKTAVIGTNIQYGSLFASNMRWAETTPCPPTRSNIHYYRHLLV